MTQPMGLLIWSIWGMRLAAGSPHLHATLDSAGGALSFSYLSSSEETRFSDPPHYFPD